MLNDQNDFHSLFREKSNKNRESRNLVIMTRAPVHCYLATENCNIDEETL